MEYWLKYRMPVLLVLYDPGTETAYWQLVNRDTTVSTGEGFAVDVPRSNVFDARCTRDLDSIAEGLLPPDDASADGLIDRRDVLDLPWMWMIHDGHRLLLEVDERLAPRDGRCVLRLIAEDKHGQPTTVRVWPWAFLPRKSLEDELARLFPWADKAVDIRYYRDRLVADFLVAHGRWDAEEDAYRLDADFDEWLQDRLGSGVSPYAESADGTTALWRIELMLNSRGMEAIERDEKEMLDAAYADWHSDEPRSRGLNFGWYELRSIDHTYSRYGYLDQLLFVYGYDDEGMEEIETLMVEPRLFDENGEPKPLMTDAILRHARGQPARAGLHRAFCQRFAAEFDADGGVPKLPHQDIIGWFDELAAISRPIGG